jgi:deoxyhypusine synthase
MTMPNKPVRDIKLRKGMTVKELVTAYGDGCGFSAKKLADASAILSEMRTSKGCVKFLSFPACIIATGARGVIVKMIREGMCDVIITTCGTLDHDLARTVKDYYHGRFDADDAELYAKGINRLGNVFVPNESYGIALERLVQPILAELWKGGMRRPSTRELCSEFGKRVEDPDSILRAAYEMKVPIYVPGITDGAFGSQLWMFWQEHRELGVDLMKDEQELMDLVFTAKKSGAVIVGGGISKHHVIWWNQFRDGLDYAVYITTAPEHDGSLSGARMREAVSWGKVQLKAKYVTVEGDASVLLPILVAVQL